MPHKRNPVVCEQVCGLARLLRTNALAALENVALWHERDISHSSVERVILPDTFILADYLLAKMTTVIDKMPVYAEKMKANLGLTQGLICSQAVLLALTEKGAARQEAYELVQGHAMAAWRGEGEFRDFLLADARVAKYLSEAEIGELFSLDRHTRHIDRIFDRVFDRLETPTLRGLTWRGRRSRSCTRGRPRFVYATKDPDKVIMYFKDDATAFNAKKKGTIKEKGVLNCAISTRIFRLPGEPRASRRTTVETLSDREMLLSQRRHRAARGGHAELSSPGVSRSASGSRRGRP